MFQNMKWSDINFNSTEICKKSLKEPFVASANDIVEHRKLAKFFSETQPYGIFTGKDDNLNIPVLTGTVMPGNNTVTVTPYNAAPNTININTGDLFERKEKECIDANGGTSFQKLSYLNNTQSATERFRCGWIYDNSNPEQGIGAFGSRDGPSVSTKRGEWYWNLADAKQKLHESICKEVKDCRDLGAGRYNNMCGYCTTSQTAVPISGGVAAYPYTAPCVTTALVTSADKCPIRPPVPNPSVSQSSQMPSVMMPSVMLGRTLNACDPFENGRLAAACLVSKASQVGCSENGSLITSLKTGSSTNYFESLEKVPAYKEYQRRTDNSISEAALKQGRATLDVILSQFGAIQTNTASSKAGLQAASRDLCLEKGSFETFDFCSEIRDSDYTPSISLDCIQREFLRQGGQRTGSLYPTQDNLSYWRQFTPWSNLRNKLRELKNKSMETTEGFQNVSNEEQRESLRAFQGLPVEPVLLELGDIPGVERFYFTRDYEITRPNMGVFLGRRIETNVSFHSIKSYSSQEQAVFSIANIKPPSNKQFNIMFKGDVGFLLTKNMPLKHIYPGGGSVIKDTELTSQYNSFSSISDMSTSQPGGGGVWTFYSSFPNIVIVYSPGGRNTDILFSTESGHPPECGCYGRAESGLRMYNKNECDMMGGIHYPSGECHKKTVGSFSWECRNIATPCDNGWNSLTDMYYLTQESAAPMISFNVEQSYQKYNSPYLFCDRRLGSHKMTWASYVNPPTWVFRENSTNMNTFPLGLSYASMVGGGMFADFSIKRYSFQTMAIILRFTKLPENGQTGDLLIFWPSDWSYGAPTIYVETTNNVTRIALRTGSGYITDVNGTPLSTNNPVIRTGETYIVTLRMIRSGPISQKTISSMQIGAGILSTLQQNPSALIQSNPLQYKNPLQLEDPKSNLSNRLLLPPSASCHYDLFSIQLFDYNINEAVLQRIAKGNWARLKGGIFS